MVNIAVANGYIPSNPLLTFKVERKATEIEFLEEEELNKLINYKTSIARYDRARDFFLFGCFTGLSYIDIKTLAPEHFETDNSGRIWIKKHRVKTGVLSRIPLLPMAKKILDKYKGNDTLIPIQHIADVNKHLKDIILMLKINKRITFHTRRHNNLSYSLKTNGLQN